jgi:hypothetical protein
MLVRMALLAQANSKPIMRLLSHASTASVANVGDFNPSHAAAYGTGVAPDKIAMRWRLPSALTLCLFWYLARQHHDSNVDCQMMICRPCVEALFDRMVSNSTMMPFLLAFFAMWPHALLFDAAGTFFAEIGRASCRERVLHTV